MAADEVLTQDKLLPELLCSLSFGVLVDVLSETLATEFRKHRSTKWPRCCEGSTEPRRHSLFQAAVL